MAGVNDWPFRRRNRDWVFALFPRAGSIGFCAVPDRTQARGPSNDIIPAAFTSVGQNTFVQLVGVGGWSDEHEFKKGTVFHQREAYINQEIYGLPEWLPALQSALLNESATLFRRKYYNNGSHAGFIMYTTDTAQNETDVAALRSALKAAKGPGNFRNLFMYAPGGKKDGIQLIPVSEVAAKDEFASIKNISRDDMLAALRIPPQLMGIVPQNAVGFGSIKEAAQIWAMNELEPVQARLQHINDWLGEEVVRFRPFEPVADNTLLNP